jgi:SAM-dependent methyltransferase
VITVDLNRLKIETGNRILDIGCGSGRHTAAAYAHPDVVAIGADRNLKDLDAARNRMRLHDRLAKGDVGRWALLAADATALPFRDNFFDGVICSEVLEHIADHYVAVREIMRVVKPGRFLAVSVPRRWPEKICWRLSKDYRTSSGGHVRIYAQRGLRAMFQSAGGEYCGIHWAHSLHTPYWWLKCLVGPAREDHTWVKLYHRFLTWDMMKKPRLTRFLDKLLNPLMGKSVVMYFRKDSSPQSRRERGELK